MIHKIYGEILKFTLAEIISATGAKLIWGEEISGKFEISTDTRTIKENDIYLPLRGENFDGHTFIPNALNSGAIGYFTQNEKVVDKNAKFVLYVKNSLVAYLELANYIRNKINPKIIAITGSSGKTTVKEMMSSVLATTFKTHKSKLNHNNEIGLCQTMFLMPEDTEVAVVEFGMRNLGEIELLAKYLEPNIGIITNIGTAHVERLGSVENIATAKCEILDYIKQDGAFVSIKDEKVISRAKKFDFEKDFLSIEDVKNIEIAKNYTSFVWQEEKYELQIEGEHNIENALLVMRTAEILGVSTENIKKGLWNFHQIEKRWEITNHNGLTFINDSYNANPESMKAVLKTFLSVYRAPVYLVLGDMAELGKDEIKYHKEIGAFLNNYEDVKLLTVGDLAKFICQNTKIEAHHFNSHKECAQYIADNCESGATLLFKASRVMQFEKIIEEIKNYDNV
ncbi:UDP-N-acetylmuramoyl-tripeptide--D-alanyl-D-alanine ligase [bacterium]|nr:UDP-N-acetylmuramoyl-tripeptide--D-alanyl-D-alanine ligase [bacterium]